MGDPSDIRGNYMSAYRREIRMPTLYGRRTRRLSRGISVLAVACLSVVIAGGAQVAAAFEPADSTLPARGNNWALPFRIAESVDIDADSITAPWLGMSPASTDDFDRFLDFVAPPPTPIAGRPSAYLLNVALDGDFQTLIADMRQFPLNPFTTVTWTLVVDNAAETDWVVSWDAAGIPRLWAAATVTDGETEYDMRAVDSLTVPAGAEAVYEITVNRAAVGAPTPPPGAGLFGLLQAGQMVAANVPDSVYNGLSLTLNSDPVETNPTDSIVLPSGFLAPSTNLMRAVRIERDGVDVTEFDEPIEIEISFDDADLSDGITVDQLIPFRIDDDGEIEILRVVSRGESSVTFETYRLSTVGLGESDGNEAPTVRESVGDVTINSLPGSSEVELVPSVTTSVFYDDETPVDDLTYEATVDDATILSEPTVSGSLVTLTTTGTANGSTVVTVTATDGSGLSTSTAFTVTITAPVIASIDDQTTDEDTPISVTLTVDYDGDFVVDAYESETSSGILSAVDADTSSVTLTPSADVSGSTEVVVDVYDASDSSIFTSATFALTVEAVNDAPTVQEAVADHTIYTVPGSVDVELADTEETAAFSDDETAAADLTYSASVDDTTILSAPSVSGSLVTLTTAGTANGSTTVTVTATDDGGLSTSTTFTVTVAAPIITAIDDQTTDEDTPISVAISVDYDGDFVVDAYESETGSSLLATVDADASSITLTPSADVSGSTEVFVEAYDASDTSIYTSATFGLTVDAVNDAPTLDTPDDVTMSEDDDPTEVAISAGNPGGGDDEEEQTLTYNATSSDTTILADPEATVSGTSVSLLLEPQADANGEVTVTVTATDDGGPAESVSVDFAVTIDAVEDAPTLGEILSRAVTLGSAAIISLEVSDPDSGSFDITVEDDPTLGVAVVDASALTVTYTATVATGDDSFSVFVTDSEGNVSNAVTASITVTAIPDQAPVVPSDIAIDVPKNVATQIALSAYAVDPESGPLTFTIAESVANGELTLSDSAATYTPSQGFVGADGFIFSVSDGANTSAGIVQLNVVNFLPTVTAEDATTEEDTPVDIELAVDDADGDTVTVIVASDPAAGSVSIDGLTATYSPNAEFSGPDAFTLRPNDGAEDGEDVEVAVVVTPVDDPARLNTVRSLSSVTVSEGASDQIIDLGGEQPLYFDPDSEVTYAAGSSDLDVVDATIDDTLLTLEFGSVGIAAVSVGAVGADETTTFAVEVVAGEVPNEPPSVAPVRSQSGIEGEELAFTPSVTDPDGDDLEFSFVDVERLSTPNAGDPDAVVEVDPDSGEVTFTVESISGVQAIFRVTTDVTDGKVDPIEIPVLIFIIAANEAPEIVVDEVVVAAVEEAQTIEVRVTDADEEDTHAMSVAVRDHSISSSALRDAVRAYNRADVDRDGADSVKTFTITPDEDLASTLVTLRWVADDGQDAVAATTQLQVGEDVKYPPVISAIDDVEVEEGGNVVIEIEVEDPDAEDGDVVTLSTSGLPGSATLDPTTGTIEWLDIGYSAAGRYVLTVTATDVDGLEATASVTVRVQDVNRAPALSLTAPMDPALLPDADGDALTTLALPTSLSVQMTGLAEFAVTATDPDEGNVDLGVRGLPAWARVSPGGTPREPVLALTLEPPRNADPFTLLLTATDDGGLTDERAIQVQLTDPPNTPPAIDDIPALTVVEEETVAFTVTAEDLDEDELVVSVGGLPDNASFDDPSFEWETARGDAENSPYEVTVAADDGEEGGFTEKTVSITVLPAPNRPPTVDDLPDVAIAVGESASVDVGGAVADPDDDPITITIETGFAASNVAFDEATGELDFVSDGEVEGAGEGFYPVVVRAADDREGAAATTFLLVVEPLLVTDADAVVVAATLVSPQEGTAADLFEFSAIIKAPAGSEPTSVVLDLTRDDGATQALPLEATGDGDFDTGATYSGEALLAPGAYTYSVTATSDDAEASATGDGPTVLPAAVDISDVGIDGTTGDVAVQFSMTNPNPGQTVALAVEFRSATDDAWAPAQVSGAISDLRSGSHAFVWHSAGDAPAAGGEEYVLRLSVDERSERTSDSFPLVNALPAAPSVDPLDASNVASLVVTGTASNPGGDVTVTANDEVVASAVVDADGSFRAATSDLSPDTYAIRAVVSVLGLTGEPSAPVTAIVDPIEPQITIISPESGAEVPTVDPLISFRVDFGLSGGDPNLVDFALNGRPVATNHDPTTGVFTTTDTLVDQRIYLATVRATKDNGLSATLGWPFFVNSLASDITSPRASSFEPLGAIRLDTPEIRFAVSDGETGIDSATVSALLDGVPLDLQYRPNDERSGSALGSPSERLDDGVHNVAVTFADLAGNEGTAAWTFVVKTQAAGPPQLGGGQGQAAPNQAIDPDLTILAVTNITPYALAGEADPDSQVLISVDGAIAGVVQPDGDGLWSFDVDFAEDGAVELRLQTRDEVGNISAPSEPVTIIYDTRAPELQVANPILGAPTGALQPTFQGTIVDSLSGVDPASVALVIDGEAQDAGYDPSLGAFAYAAAQAFASGDSIDVTLSASDAAGNEATVSGTVSFDDRLADVSAPVILNPTLNGESFVSGVDTRISDKAAVVQFVVSDDLSGVARVFGTSDGAAVEFDIDGDVASLTLDDIEVGEHVLLVRGVDAQGNTSAVIDLRFVRDIATDAPVVQLDGLTNAQDIEITGAGVEDGAEVVVTVNGLPVVAFVEAGEFRTAATRLLEGVNEIIATATDAVGNSASSEPVQVTLDTTPPDVTFLTPIAGSVGLGTTDTVRAQVDDASGIDRAVVGMTLDDVPVDPTVSDDGLIEYIADEPFEGGDPLGHFVSVTVSDLAGNEARLGVEFFVDNVTPTIEGVVPADGEILQTLEPQVAATISAPDLDPTSIEFLFGIDGEALSSKTDDPNFEFAIASGQVAYFPLLDDGETYQAVLRAADEAGNVAEASWAFTVDIEGEDDTDPLITILYPQPGDSVDDSGLDILSFSVGDSAGIGDVTIYVNDPSGAEPLTLGGLVDEGIAEFNEQTGVVRIHGLRIFVALQLRGGGFSFDPLELNALERSLTGGDNASFDPLELNALERSLDADAAGGGDVGALERSLTSSAGLLGVGDNTMTVEVADLSGNVSFATWSFNVSLDPPPAPALDGERVLTKSRSASVTGRVPGLAGSTSLPVVVAVRVNGVNAGLVTIVDESGEFTMDSLGLNAGENEVTATAEDSAGNLSDRSDTLTIVLDETSPSLSVDPLPSAAAGTTLTISGVVADNEVGDLTSLVILVGGVETVLATGQGPFSAQVSLADGNNEVVVVATDAAGNETASDTATVAVDVAAPTTAPASVSATPTADSRGINLAWAADPNASTYSVFRSSQPFTDASALSPLAASVTSTGYADTTVLPGATVYYAVVSIDAAGNSDPSVLSPVLATALIKDRGGVVSLLDGTRLFVPARGLFSNLLLAATVELSEVLSTPPLNGAVDGTARAVAAKTPSGAGLTTYNLPATLSIPVPIGVDIDDESPVVYALDGEAWNALVSTTNALGRTSSASVSGTGTFQLGAAGVSATPWDPNGDGVVNIIDLVTVASVFGTTAEPGSLADINGDGLVNIVDLVTVSSHFGETTGAASAAPSLASGGAPSATVRLDRVRGEGDTVELEIHARSLVALSGYEFRLVLPEGVTVVSASAGELLDGAVFWMPPVTGERSLHVAAARLGATADNGGPVDGVAARLTLRATGAAAVAEASFREIRLVDAEGGLLAHRAGPPVALALSGYTTDLLPNYPNPFNPETWIPFTLAADSAVTIRIYGVNGAPIRTLDLGYVESGDHRPRAAAAYWDGRNELGERVASGVYFYELEAGEYREMRRLVVLK